MIICRHKLNKKEYRIFFFDSSSLFFIFLPTTFLFSTLKGKKMQKITDIKNTTLFQGVTQSEEVSFTGDKCVSESKLEL